MSNCRILITGANGFLGQKVAQSIQKLETFDTFTTSRRWNSSVSFDLKNHTLTNLTNEFHVRGLLNKVKPDVIIHLAANPVPKVNPLKANSLIEDNVIATHNLIYNCEKDTHFIYSGSVTVYGDFSKTPKNESAPLKPESLYAESKRSAENLFRIYKDKISYNSLRFCSIIGAGSHHGLVRDVYQKLNSDSKCLELIGDSPGSSKPYLHISDAVSAIEYVLLNRTRYKIHNICPMDYMSVLEVADTIMETSGRNKEKIWLGQGANWRGDNSLIYANNELIRLDGFRFRFNTSREAIIEATRDIMQQCE